MAIESDAHTCTGLSPEPSRGSPTIFFVQQLFTSVCLFLPSCSAVRVGAVYTHTYYRVHFTVAALPQSTMRCRLQLVRAWLIASTLKSDVFIGVCLASLAGDASLLW